MQMTESSSKKSFFSMATVVGSKRFVFHSLWATVSKNVLKLSYAPYLTPSFVHLQKKRVQKTLNSMPFYFFYDIYTCIYIFNCNMSNTVFPPGICR
jgi:hypothetical protein